VRRRLLLVSAVLFVAVASAAAYIHARSVRGVFLVIHGVPGGYAAVFVEAVEPRGPTPLMVGAYRVSEGSTLAIELPRGGLTALAEEWRQRRPGLEGFGAIIHMLVVDPETGNVTLELVDSVNIPVKAVLDGGPVAVEAAVERLHGRLARLRDLRVRRPSPLELLGLHPARDRALEKTIKPVETPSPLGGEEPPWSGDPPAYQVCVSQPTPNPYAMVITCWDPVFHITPADMAAMYSGKPGMTMYQDGLLYVATPIAIVYNKYAASGVITFTIGESTKTKSYRVYPSFGADLSKLIKAVKRGEFPIPLPSINLWRGSGYTWGGKEYHMATGAPIAPNTNATFYIYARPFYAAYNVTEYIQTMFGTFVKHVGTEAEAVISDVALEKRIIAGIPRTYIKAGYYYGSPPKQLMKALLLGGSLRYAATLEPKQGVFLQDLVADAAGSCGTEFGVSIPVGAFAAAFACSALMGIPVIDALTAPACIPFMAVASNFQVSFVAEPGQLKIQGIMVNNGAYLGAGENIEEFVYVGVGDYLYDVEGCRTRVPLGMYIESR